MIDNGHGNPGHSPIYYMVYVWVRKHNFEPFKHLMDFPNTTARNVLERFQCDHVLPPVKEMLTLFPAMF